MNAMGKMMGLKALAALFLIGLGLITFIVGMINIFFIPEASTEDKFAS